MPLPLGFIAPCLPNDAIERDPRAQWLSSACASSGSVLPLLVVLRPRYQVVAERP